MKIAFIVDEFPKLSETFILNQVTGLVDLGFEVSIFARSNPKEEKIHPDVDGYHLMDRVYYGYGRQIPESKFARVCKAIPLAVSNMHRSPFPLLQSLNVFRYGKKALSLKMFYTVIPFLDADILHCHFGYNGVFGCFLKALGLKAPLITTFHGYDMSSYVSSRGKDVYGDLFSVGDLFLPISDYWRKKLIAMGVDEGKICVHRMGIDLDRFQFQEKTRRAGEPLRILTVGRLAEKKGYEFAIRGVAELLKKGKEVLYSIAGSGPLGKELAKLVSDLGITGSVKFLGAVDQDEVIPLYRDSHVFLLASITAVNGDQEGIPVVLMEAQAAGLPIISTYHSGIPELVEDGKSGFLVPERDTVTLAEKLSYLADHPELWREMGTRGRKIVEERYDIKRLNRQLADIYRTVLKDRSPFQAQNIGFKNA